MFKNKKDIVEPLVEGGEGMVDVIDISAGEQLDLSKD
jgi:hypothetical protein